MNNCRGAELIGVFGLIMTCMPVVIVSIGFFGLTGQALDRDGNLQQGGAD